VDLADARSGGGLSVSIVLPAAPTEPVPGTRPA
jgi:hypothetical protein